MISDGDIIYVPFWVIQEFLDAANPEPFVPCKVLKRYTARVVHSHEPVQVCDLEIKPELHAPSIPADYLIEKKDLKTWAEKIGDWFKQYPEKIA